MFMNTKRKRHVIARSCGNNAHDRPLLDFDLQQTVRYLMHRTVAANRQNGAAPRPIALRRQLYSIAAGLRFKQREIKSAAQFFM
jgi:hypothetical protein